MTTFGARLRAGLHTRGPLCVGIDPHEGLLTAWGLPVDASGVRDFGLRVVEAVAGRVAVIKPQVSFFERFGSAGYLALEEVMAAARAAGLLVIADAKRGDIGTTMDAYAAAWLTPGAPLEADALTVNPYLGVGALASTFALALVHGKGVFVLSATSNPEGAAVQSATTDHGPVSRAVADAVAGFDTAEDEWSSLGLVVGATVDLPARGLDASFGRTLPILAPGFGAQGAEPGDLARIFGHLAPTVIASESRSILSAGPGGLAERIQYRTALYRGGTHG